MKTTSRWTKTGMVAAMMVAAISAGAQTTNDDAAKAADEQAQVAAEQANAQARVQARDAAQQARSEAEMARTEARIQMESARIRAQVDSHVTAQIGAQMQAQMLPMMAKMELSMAPLRAERLTRSATMQAHMMARGIAMQDGMVAVGDPQVKDDLFAGTEKFATGASDVTDVNLGPDMLGMVSGKHGGDLAHKLNFMVVRTYEYPKPGMYNLADVDVYRQKLRAGNWNCFIHTQESRTGESTDICNRALPNGQGNEMVILTVEPKELTFIHMSGTGSLADLSKMGRGFGGGSIPTPPEPPTPPSSPH